MQSGIPPLLVGCGSRFTKIGSALFEFPPGYQKGHSFYIAVFRKLSISFCNHSITIRLSFQHLMDSVVFAKVAFDMLLGNGHRVSETFPQNSWRWKIPRYS